MASPFVSKFAEVPVFFPLQYCLGICQVVLMKPSCSVCDCPVFVFISCDTIPSIKRKSTLGHRPSAVQINNKQR